MENSIEQKKQKTKQLEDFIKLHSNSAEQGSLQWVEERKSIIGGSELSTVLGANAFSQIYDLIAQKVGITSFGGNIATKWGNLMENVSELVFKTIYLPNDQIYATGGIQHPTIKNHKFSPDGLCILNKKITLLEFKSPYGSVPNSRVPKNYLPQVLGGMCTIQLAETAIFVNNMIRKCSLKHLDFTLDYDNRYHRDTELKLKNIETVIANGLILFYIKEENIWRFLEKFDEFIYNKSRNRNKHQDDSDSDSDCEYVPPIKSEFACSDSDDESINSDSSDESIIDDGTSILYRMNDLVNETSGERLLKNLIDLGTEDKEKFDQFLTLYKPDHNEPSFIDIKCIKPQINKVALLTPSKTFITPKELNFINTQDHADIICKKYNFNKIIEKFVNISCKKQDVPIGYLPWKLLRSSNIIVEKDPEFLNNMEQDINKTASIVQDINRLASIDEKLAKLEELYPDNEVVKKYYVDKAPTYESFKDFI